MNIFLPYRKIIIIALVATVGSLPFSHFKIALFGWPLYVPEIGVLLALLFFWFGRRKKEFPLPTIASLDQGLCLGILFFFFGAIFSFLANPFSVTGLGMLKTWFVFPLTLAWLLWRMAPTQEERRLFLQAWLVTAVGVAFGALLHGGFTYDGRLVAWFLSPNYLAIFTAPGVLLALFFLREMRSVFTRHSISLVLGLVGFLAVLFLTHSYGVWLAVFGAVFLAVVFGKSEEKKKYLVAVLALFAIVAAAFFFLERENPKWQALATLDERSSMASRLMIWQAAGKMIGDSPVLGIGPGRFQEVYLEYQKFYPPYLEWAVPQPHNIILAVWLQTGLLGLVGFILLIVRAIQILWQNKNRETALLIGLLMLYLIYGIFDTPYFKTDLAFAFWLIIGLVVSQQKNQ